MGKFWIGFLLLSVSLGFAPSGEAVKTTKLVKLYRIQTKGPSEIASFALGNQKPYLAAVHPGEERGTWSVSVWSASSDKPVFTHSLGGFQPEDPPPVVRFSGDDKWLAIGVQTDIFLVDVGSWKVVATLARASNLSPQVRVNGLEFSVDGKLLLARYMVPTAPNEQQPVVPYDLGSKEPLRIHILSGPISYMAVGETQGPWFAIVERYAGGQPSFVLRRLAPEPDELTRWWFTSAQYLTSADQKLRRKVASCRAMNECEQAVGVSVSRSKIRALLLDPTRRILAVWDAKSGEFEKLLAKTTSGEIQAAVALRAPRAAAIVPGGSSPALVVWDLESGKEIYHKRFTPRETSWRTFLLSAAGQFLAAQDGAGSVTVFALGN